MLALWLENQQLRLIEDQPWPVPQAGEALIRVQVAGICNTDLELVKGYYPFTGVPGHEFVGRVVSAPAHEHWLGKRVVGEINAPCGECEYCQRGLMRHCEERTVLGISRRNGVFAEYCTLPVQNLHPVPDALSDDWAVFTEPVAAALQIQEQLKINAGDRVLVIGSGKLGQLVAQTLALRGCQLSVAGRRLKTLALLNKRGLHTLNTPDIKPRCADVVIECTGDPEGLALAQRAIRPRGTIVLKSTYAGRAACDVSALVVDEVTVIGSRCGPFEPALLLLAAGKLDLRALISARYPLTDALTAFDHAAESGVLKVLLEIPNAGQAGRS